MTIDYTDIFDRYLDNSLSESERQNFDLRLSDDAEFSKAFAEYSATPKAIQFKAARMIYAVSVVIFLIGIGVWTFVSQASTPQSLCVDHFEVYPGLSKVRGYSALNPLWSNFADSYSAQEYEACLIILGEVEFSEVGPDYLIHFYGGLCLMSMASPNPQRALKEFEEVLVSDNNFHAESLWYQGLACLSLGNEGQARDKFIMLRISSEFKSTEVEKILDDL